MDSKKIEIFIEVAELQNISAAAEKLHISHQGVSQQIKALENELGVFLFERSNNRIGITDAGKKAYDIFKPVMTQLTQANDELFSYIQSRKHGLTIAYFSGIGYSKTIAPVVEKLSELNGGADVEVVSGNIKSCVERIKSNQVDAAIIPVQVGEIIADLGNLTLKSVKMSVVVSSKHPWATKSELTVDDIREGKLLVYDNRKDSGAKPFMEHIDVGERLYVDGFDNYMLRLARGEAFGINFEDYSVREWEVKLLDLPPEYATEMNLIMIYKPENIHAKSISKLV